MSNQEKNEKEISKEAAKTMDDIFRSPDVEDLDATKLAQEFENKPVNQQAFQPKSKQILQSKVSKAPEPVIPSEDLVTDARIKALEMEIKKLREGQNGVKVSKAPEKPAPLDFSKLTEDDVYDLDIPIEAIKHDLPDWLIINLKDKNYAARWVHKTPRRLGPMLAKGWTYVTIEDLEDPTKLKESLDENGRFRYDDVIACKIPKMKYFGQLRANHERALNQVNPKFHHQRSKKAVEAALQSAPSGGRPGKGYADYVNNNQLEVFIPGER